MLESEIRGWEGREWEGKEKWKSIRKWLEFAADQLIIQGKGMQRNTGDYMIQDVTVGLGREANVIVVLYKCL